MSSGGLVLLVDDDPDCQTLLCLALKRVSGNQEIAVAQDGEEAMAYLNGDGAFADRTKFPFPRLVLLDLRMPRMDGFQFLAWVRKQSAFPFLPVVVLTISAYDKDIWRAYQAGANSFMTKGVDVDELAQQLQAVVEHWMRFATSPPPDLILPGTTGESTVPTTPGPLA